MTTITVGVDCLVNVDKLQSLLKLRFDKLYGQTITRGTTVNWAVEQQIKALATPITVNSSTTTFSDTGSYTATSCGNPLMPFITYMPNSSFNTITTTSGQILSYGGA